MLIKHGEQKVLTVSASPDICISCIGCLGQGIYTPDEAIRHALLVINDRPVSEYIMVSVHIREATHLGANSMEEVLFASPMFSRIISFQMRLLEPPTTTHKPESRLRAGELTPV